MFNGNLSIHASLNFFCSTCKRSEMRVNSTFDPGWTSDWFWSEDWQERHHWPAKAWWQDCPAGRQDCLPCWPDCLLLAGQIAAISPPSIPSQSIHPAPSTSRILGPWITSFSGPLHFPLNISSFARDICSGNDFEAINLYFYRPRKMRTILLTPAASIHALDWKKIAEKCCHGCKLLSSSTFQCLGHWRQRSIPSWEMGEISGNSRTRRKSVSGHRQLSSPLSYTSSYTLILFLYFLADVSYHIIQLLSASCMALGAGTSVNI